MASLAVKYMYAVFEFMVYSQSNILTTVAISPAQEPAYFTLSVHQPSVQVYQGYASATWLQGLYSCMHVPAT